MDKRNKRQINYESAYNLKRLADTLDTIVAMIKEDLERSGKYMKDQQDDQKQTKVYSRRDPNSGWDRYR